MSEISATLVKDLRAKTGAGMMDCKKALAETAGDLEAAVDWLRKKGLAAAAKKASRVASEGLVGVAVAGSTGAVVEINSETDFVARNAGFQDLVKNTAALAVTHGKDADTLAAAPYPGTGRTVKDEITNAIATIGENMNLRRVKQITAEPGVVAAYMHSAQAPGLGKIGVLVGLKSTGDKAKLEALGKQIAMHIAAAAPLSLSTADLDPAAVERERNVLLEQAKASGKTEDIARKMVEGRLRKYYEDVVLLEQTFIIDNETKIAKVVQNAAKDVGAPVELTGFARFSLGEGIEKQAEDFAAEVAKITG